MAITAGGLLRLQGGHQPAHHSPLNGLSRPTAAVAAGTAPRRRRAGSPAGPDAESRTPCSCSRSHWQTWWSGSPKVSPPKNATDEVWTSILGWCSAPKRMRSGPGPVHGWFS
jgi:hypothetical protein